MVEQPNPSTAEEEHPLADLTPIDNPNAPYISCDGFAGVLIRDHTVKINLTSVHGTHPRSGGGAQEVIVARLVMSTSALARFHHVLSDFIKKMQEAGAVPEFNPEDGLFTWRSPEDKSGDKK